MQHKRRYYSGMNANGICVKAVFHCPEETYRLDDSGVKVMLATEKLQNSKNILV